jgi:hypothetical protein
MGNNLHVGGPFDTFRNEGTRSTRGPSRRLVFEVNRPMVTILARFRGFHFAPPTGFETG